MLLRALNKILTNQVVSPVLRSKTISLPYSWYFLRKESHKQEKQAIIPDLTTSTIKIKDITNNTTDIKGIQGGVIGDVFYFDGRSC